MQCRVIIGQWKALTSVTFCVDILFFFLIFAFQTDTGCLFDSFLNTGTFQTYFQFIIIYNFSQCRNVDCLYKRLWYIHPFHCWHHFKDEARYSGFCAMFSPFFFFNNQDSFAPRKSVVFELYKYLIYFVFFKAILQIYY